MRTERRVANSASFPPLHQRKRRYRPNMPAHDRSGLVVLVDKLGSAEIGSALWSYSKQGSQWLVGYDPLPSSATPASNTTVAAQPIETVPPADHQYGQPAAIMGPAYSDNTVVPFDVAAGTMPEFATPRCVRTVRRDMPTQAVYQRPSRYGDADRAYPEPSAPRYVETRDVHHRRSTGRSVEIVAGSAGVGAAIVAIAAGGKGAGIGALAGGRRRLRV